ncbi:hypothetical protein SeMB42_g01235 [Synchytrium endobioticum]|uniref:3'-5' exonuclease domain-containing protein n=1 Tax=Synchytrium endobioticum TaxID=286115 RepID=A0A507DP92_9FUNG|nr:hypothetical protein SeMB42_g01235 [Synchytrium endobioticum]
MSSLGYVIRRPPSFAHTCLGWFARLGRFINHYHASFAWPIGIHPDINRRGPAPRHAPMCSTAFWIGGKGEPLLRQPQRGPTPYLLLFVSLGARPAIMDPVSFTISEWDQAQRILDAFMKWNIDGNGRKKILHIGFDRESASGSLGPPSTIQFALTPKVAVIFQLQHIRNSSPYPERFCFPPALEAMLSSAMNKHGVGVAGDVQAITRYYNCQLSHFWDLNSAQSVTTRGLAYLYGLYCGQVLPKWSNGLGSESWDSLHLPKSAIRYAAMDAIAGLRIYNQMRSPIRRSDYGWYRNNPCLPMVDGGRTVSNNTAPFDLYLPSSLAGDADVVVAVASRMLKLNVLEDGRDGNLVINYGRIGQLLQNQVPLLSLINDLAKGLPCAPILNARFAPIGSSACSRLFGQPCDMPIMSISALVVPLAVEDVRFKKANSLIDVRLRAEYTRRNAPSVIKWGRGTGEVEAVIRDIVLQDPIAGYGKIA